MKAIKQQLIYDELTERLEGIDNEKFAWFLTNTNENLALAVSESIEYFNKINN